jgi:hypothetical protein
MEKGWLRKLVEKKEAKEKEIKKRETEKRARFNTQLVDYTCRWDVAAKEVA